MKNAKKRYAKPQALAVRAESVMAAQSKGDGRDHGNLSQGGNDGAEWFVSRRYREITWVWSDDEQETSWTGQ